MKYTEPALTRERQADIICQHSTGNYYRLSGSKDKYSLNRIGSQSMCAKRQMELLGSHATILLESMGFPNDWRGCAGWCVKRNQGAGA